MSRSLVHDNANSRLERVPKLASVIDAAVPSDAHDADRAAYDCSLLGITIAEARRRILPDRLHWWLGSGATAIIADRCRLVVEAGVVVTVIGRQRKPKRRRWSPSDEIEMAA